MHARKFAREMGSRIIMSEHRIGQVLAELKELSGRRTEKAVTMWVQPIDEGWSCELDLSNEELEIANELAAELSGLMDFKVTFPSFPYRPK